MQKIYLDNAATTCVSSDVLGEMLPVFCEDFGNANSLHSFGRDAQNLVDKARDRVAKGINAERGEIFFTSGGTEANNWAIFGLAMANRSRGKHVITSQIEHKSVLEACKKLEQNGFHVTYLPVDKTGLVDVAELLHQLDDDTVLVSVMTANNEIGTIQNIMAISQIVHERGAIFHTDAVQALGNLLLDVKNLQIDAMSISSHKIHGPKGVGALFVKNGVKIEPLIQGGEQERGKRGGTVNTAGVVGFGKAVENATQSYTIDSKKKRILRDYFVEKVKDEIPNVQVNGHPHQKLPGIASVSFFGTDGEALMMMLDMQGVAVSNGAACSTGSVEKSHVLTAIGLSEEQAQSTVRFSFSTFNTKEEVDKVVEILKQSVEKLRLISPVTSSQKRLKGGM